jgi:hypothetical protein
MPCLHARALKCSVVLYADEHATIGDPPLPRVTLNVAVPDFGTLTADIAAKSVRKVQAVIAEHDVDGVACVLQGEPCSRGTKVAWRARTGAGMAVDINCCGVKVAALRPPLGVQVARFGHAFQTSSLRPAGQTHARHIKSIPSLLHPVRLRQGQ